MRFFWKALLAAAFLAGCADNRVYEDYVDFPERHWLVSTQPAFKFNITDTAARYNVVANVRNAVSYPYSRLFLKFHLTDTLGHEIQQDLVSEYLFDAKTGKPHGKSGLGDIYDHQITLLSNVDFSRPGFYSVTLEQFMRTDTLQGVLAVGLRVEKAGPKENQK